ncbi:DNA alkylation repair protein [Parathalassolituus penaei]|uniref:DNA alkylation repair protein n=1 Tax=Parathalassolituus penaei TaxID=2997323 RepID=A0A9X3IUT5_9GAMM|nr:DNA alkylation repair protein [Parathalassolituus penaei]MCY0966518.1 DNA alkylation repair protein [Parathalassolituus penaei]
MAAPLKERYGLEVPRELARQIALVYPAFDSAAFIAQAETGYLELELLDRGRHLGRCLAGCLPADYPEAVAILLASTAEPLPVDGFALGGFFYLPHTSFVSQFGLEHLQVSLQALNHLTCLFTAEFSIRPFIQRHTQQTLEQLRVWATDENEHVRRLVSEGTRTRLPWAGRLPEFQKDPALVLELLELLKDDPALYVRRSVANNLNDIGKDHPQLLVDVARRWSEGASPEREWIIRHALRSAVKRGDAGALAVLGFENGSPIRLVTSTFDNQQAVMGESIVLGFELQNPTADEQKAVVDFQVHYVKANGSTSAKVFKLKNITLAAGQTCLLQKRLSLASMTTRQHYPGIHRVEVLINGVVFSAGCFELLA